MRPSTPGFFALLATAIALSGCGSAPPRVADPSPSKTASSTASSSAPSATPTPSATPGFTLTATGDVLLHEPLWEQATADGSNGALDFGPILAGIKPLISGSDVGLCHLETPLAAPTGPFKGYPLFSGPPQIVPALKSTGYDVCSLASNHTFDQGAAGIDRTLTALDAAKISYSGAARTPAEAAKTTFLEVNKAKVAFLSYTFGFNGMPYPEGDTWRSNIIDKSAILAAAAKARKEGAQAIVLSLHWGDEYSQKPSASQLDLAPVLAASPDIDLIISHHAHVVEPIEKIGKTWVVYGLGNLLARHQSPGDANQEGLLARFSFTPSTGGRYVVTKAEYEPLLVTRGSQLRVVSVPEMLAAKNYPNTSKERLEVALSRTVKAVESRGGEAKGLRMIGGAPQ